MAVPPEGMLAMAQLVLVPPALPVQLGAAGVNVPEVTVNAGVPVSCRPEGKVSAKLVVSAACGPLLRKVTSQSKAWPCATLASGVAVPLATAALLMAVGCLAILWFPSVPGVMAAQALVGIVGAVFLPALAGISLGLVGYKWLDRRIGRNESFYHAGNVVSALSAGLLGYSLSQSWIFYVVAALSVASALTAFAIRGDEIDYELARGGAHVGNGNQHDEAARSRPHAGPRVPSFSEALADRRILDSLHLEAEGGEGGARAMGEVGHHLSLACNQVVEPARQLVEGHPHLGQLRRIADL